MDKVPIIPTPSISTHALTEGDSFQKPPEALKRSFQLTPSRRATVYRETIRYNRNISTHALTEGDNQIHCFLYDNHHFNSRPHGGRQDSAKSVMTFERFQLTPSRRATSIFASLPFGNTFQLTPSRRATAKDMKSLMGFDISTHALTEGDHCSLNHLHCQNISTHALTEGDFRISFSIGIWFPFQLTPSRRATIFQRRFWDSSQISTHALTEGDSKFRQIFLLNRGYAYLISLYFLPHFISLLPQILSFQQKSFKFQVRIFLLFSVHLAFALQNQCVHHVKSRFCTNMFYFVFVLFTQIVKPQTIGLFIYDFF